MQGCVPENAGPQGGQAERFSPANQSKADARTRTGDPFITSEGIARAQPLELCGFQALRGPRVHPPCPLERFPARKRPAGAGRFVVQAQRLRPGPPPRPLTSPCRSRTCNRLRSWHAERRTSKRCRARRLLPPFRDLPSPESRRGGSATHETSGSYHRAAAVSCNPCCNL